MPRFTLVPRLQPGNALSSRLCLSDPRPARPAEAGSNDASAGSRAWEPVAISEKSRFYCVSLRSSKFDERLTVLERNPNA